MPEQLPAELVQHNQQKQVAFARLNNYFDDSALDHWVLPAGAVVEPYRPEYFYCQTALLTPPAPLVLTALAALAAMPVLDWC